MNYIFLSVKRDDVPEPSDPKELQEASRTLPSKKGKDCLSPADLRRVGLGLHLVMSTH